MPGIEDLFAGSAPQAQPVPNATQLAQNFQNENVLNQARQAQTATALQEAQNKQRQLQISMLNGVMSLPEEQQAEALSHIVPMMNRMGPVQFDEGMTPSTAKLYMMSNVPTEQIPQFQMMNQQAGIYNTIRQIEEAKANAAGLNVSPNGSVPAAPSPGTPMPHAGVINPPSGTPMPANGQITQGQPIPQGGGSPVDMNGLDNAETHLLTVVNPQAAQAQIGQERLQLENNPAQQASIERAKTEGKNTGENELKAQQANELTNRLEQNLNAMLRINDEVPEGGFIPAGGHAYLSQALSANNDNALGAAARAVGGDTSGKGAVASSQWDQINNQQIISEIQQFIASGGANVRTNQTLERIVRAASGIDKNQTVAQRRALIMNALTEIHNKNISAQNLTGANQPYHPIPVTTSNTQPNIPEGAIAHLREHPELAPMFEQKYGVKAAQYLGGQ